MELLSSAQSSLEVRYTPGINEECPECVPTHVRVTMFLNASLKVHAPYVTEVKVV